MRWPTPLTPIIISKLIGGGGGSVTAAAVLSAMEAMSASQAEDALDAIDGEPKKLVVNITESGGVYSADKTYTEINTALSGGVTVVFKTTTESYCYAGKDGNDWICFAVNTVDASGVLTAKVLAMKPNEAIFYFLGSYTQDPLTITDLSSTSITLASAADNTEYHYGELSALTVTAITNPGEFSITFTSGSTATVLTVPNSMIMPDGFAVEANTRYEINCKDSYAVVAGWAVSA